MLIAAAIAKQRGIRTGHPGIDALLEAAPYPTTAHAAAAWRELARPNQLPPVGDWQTWVFLAGRGTGKTRGGAEWVREQVEAGGRRGALVGPTAADVRDVMIEGPSGILACATPENYPRYEPSRRRVTWPNGALAFCYSAEEPRRLRGPQHDFAWADELATWQYADAWDQLCFGLRLGADPRCAVTTTPRPVRLLLELLADPGTVTTKGNTYENEANLAPQFVRRIISRYEGTRLGRQEIHAEILTDNPAALWQRDQIEATRVTQAPDLARVVVAVDPAAGDGENAAETGIVVAALGKDGHGYVLADVTTRGTPLHWARQAVAAYGLHKADRLVAETNNGGLMVEQTVRTVAPSIAYRGVHASRGKQARAEPVAALYEQSKVHHVGTFADLEDQLCNWTPQIEESPDRLDALVWALTELMIDGAEWWIL